MPLASLGFLVGVLICQSLTELPMREWSLLIIVLIPLVLRFPEFRLIIFILLGFLYSVLIAHSKLDSQITTDLAGKDLWVNGTISKITHQTERHSRFWLLVNDLSEFPPKSNSNPGNIAKIPRKIQLSWYNDPPAISVGQQWQLKVRLKSPRGFSNPGAFDYEGWLYQNAIDATGYVRSTKNGTDNNLLMGEQTDLLTSVQQLRDALAKQISKTLEDNDHTALITALVVGDRQSVTDKQWSTLTGTGTNHLMAISGLHIGLIAGLTFFIFNQLWRRIPRAPLWIAAPRIAALAAIAAAFLYATLAGFSLPTQRAFIMITVAMVAVWFQRSFIPSQILAGALLAVLVYDPTAVMNGSFWLSFIAVAVIVFTLANRTQPQTPLLKWWWQWGRVQWVIAIGLFPLLLFWFQQVPLVSPLANFVAVPLVSLVTVPLSLLGSACLLLVPATGEWLLSFAHDSLEVLWPILDTMAEWEHLIYRAGKPPLWTLLPSLLGIIWMLAPKGIPARWLGGFWLLPLLFYPGEQIQQGSYRFTLLDVGHGLAAVIQTQNHVLIYDTGPRYSDTFNGGKFAVLPFLKSEGISHVDRVILSHDDIDHLGGYQSLIAALDIDRVMVGPGVKTSDGISEVCRQGQSWDWDGVHFTVLHPADGYFSNKDNNNSCVVQISIETDKLLLTGDMEREVETQFVKFFAANDDNLRANVLVVPHHGSLSSSSDAFVRAVQPDYALISAGYNNRYGLPKEEVVARYREVNSRILNTARDGAISFLMGKSGLSELSLHRQKARHYWTSVTN